MGRTALIVGGGIAGLSAGIALRKAGYDITLLERAPRLEPIGAALSIWGNAMAGLDWLGCGDAVRAQAHPVDSLRLARSDDRVMWGPVDIGGSDSWLPMRTDLQAALLATLGADAYRLGVHVDDLSERNGTVVAHAAGEPVAEAELAIVADGIRSPIAIALVGNAPAFRGYIGVLGVGSDAGEGQAGMAEEIWGQRDRFGLFDTGGGRRYWFYMCPAPDPDAAAAPDHAAVLRRAAAFPARVGEVVAGTAPGSLITLSISARAVPRRLGKGRIICIGDAAHAMEPNQGQGGCQGIEDAWALGVLAQRLPPEAILPKLERLRLGRIRRAMLDSALVGRAAHSPSGLVRSGLRALLRLPPPAIDRRQFLNRIAVPHYA
jgi:2-polyprenyl-6-methoxyphenol hydroxylase-like FAD-dependent oxidoreductase